MIEIVDSLWRPFIKLHTAVRDYDNCVNGEPKVIGTHDYYFDINARVILSEIDGGTEIYYLAPGHTDCVIETPAEILKAIDDLITAEQEKKAAEAEKYYQETQARVAATAAALQNNGDK